MATDVCLQMEDDEEKFIFLVTWFDNSAKINREFFLIYFLKDKSVELYDRKSRRVFLKRTPCDTVGESDFYVGSVVNILSRKLRMVSCLNEESNAKLERHSERTVVILRRDAKRELGRILDSVYKQNLLVVKLGELFLTPACANILRAYLEKEWRNLNEYLGERLIVVEILGSDSVRKTSKLLNEVSDQDDSILFQSSSIKYMSQTEIRSLDSNATSLDHSNDGYTCCIIKPHVIKEGLAGRIITDIIESGFEIAQIRMSDLDLEQSKTFLKVYEGVVPEYRGMVTQLASGPLLAMAICCSSDRCFRDLVGPADPEIGKRIRSECLRAKYGRDVIRNAVHCTDLDEDRLSEVSFFSSTSINGE